MRANYGLLFTVLAALPRMCVGAPLTQEFSAIDTALNTLKSRVDSWTSREGLTGALAIQEAYPQLRRAVNDLSTAANSATAADVNPSDIAQLSKSITGALSSLASKASDFTRIGVHTIVANDVNEIQAPTSQLIEKLYSVIATDCTKLNAVVPYVKQITDSFTATGTAYGVPEKTYPSPPVCKASATAAKTTLVRTKLTSPSAAMRNDPGESIDVAALPMAPAPPVPQVLNPSLTVIPPCPRFTSPPAGLPQSNPSSLAHFAHTSSASNVKNASAEASGKASAHRQPGQQPPRLQQPPQQSGDSELYPVVYLPQTRNSSAFNQNLTILPVLSNGAHAAASAGLLVISLYAAALIL